MANPKRCSRRRRRLWTNTSNGREEAIPALWNRFHEAGIFRVIAQCLAKFRHRRPQALVKLHECVFRPQPLAKRFPRYDFSLMFHQRDQQSEGLLLQFDAVPLAVHLSSFRENFEDTEAIQQRATGSAIMREGMRLQEVCWRESITKTVCLHSSSNDAANIGRSFV